MDVIVFAQVTELATSVIFRLLGSVVELFLPGRLASAVVYAQGLRPIHAWMVGFMLIAVHVAMAYSVQARFVRAAQAHASKGKTIGAAFWSAEWGTSFLLLPFVWIGVFFRWLGSFFGSKPAQAGKQKTQKGGAADEPSANVAAGDSQPTVSAQEERPTIYAAPALGPVFLEAAIILVALVVLFRVLAPLLALQWGVSDVQSLWLYLLFGNQVWASFFVSIGRVPAVGLAIAFWGLTAAWWWLARILRIWHQRALIAHPVPVEERTVPERWWRRWGHTDVIRVDSSYSAWAYRLGGLLAVVLLIGAVFLADGTRGTTPIGAVAAILLTVGWFLNLWLEGERVSPEAEAPTLDAAPPAPSPLPGWDAFCEQLFVRHGVRPGLSERELTRGNLIIDKAGPAVTAVSPLVLREYAIPRSDQDQGCIPNAMQNAVLSRLVPERNDRDSLNSLGGTDLNVSFVMPEVGDVKPGESLLFAAPDGGGKTILCQLAAVNFTVVTGKCALVVVPDAQQCQAMVAAIKRRLDGAPLRWTLTCADGRQELSLELREGRVPDIVVCDLEFIATRLLADAGEYKLLFSKLGLVVIDGIDQLRGRAEAHVPFVFLRLRLAVQRALGLPLEAPVTWQYLATVSDLSTAVWRWSERMLQRPLGYVACDTERCCAAVTAEESSALLMLDGSGFVDRDEQALTIRDLVSAAEAAGVPWYMRSVGQGDSPMAGVLRDLSSRPWSHRVHHVLDATIVIIEGRYTSIVHELHRVELTGLRRLRNPVQGSRTCAVFTLTDPDDRLAFYVSDARSSQRRMLDSLPHPLNYSERGEVAEAHLASELLQHELELKAILDGFGHGPVQTLEKLARRNALSIRTHTALSPQGDHLEEHVYIKARAGSLQTDTPSAEVGDDTVRLPSPVTTVRHVGGVVALRAMRSMQALDYVDPYFALFHLYPDAVIELEEKSYIVRGRDGLLLAEDRRDRHSAGDIRVEGMAEHVLSVPRRTLWLDARHRRELREQQLRLSSEPLHVHAGNLRVEGTHHATEHLDPITMQSLQQRVPKRNDAVYGAGLETNVLLLDLSSLHAPDPEHSWLTHRSRAIVTAAIRMSLGILYSDGSRVLDATLCARLDSATEAEKSQSVSAERRHWLAIMDASSGGSGAVTALERDGLEILLRLARMVIERLLSHQRLLGRWGDFWPDEFVMLPEGEEWHPEHLAREVRAVVLPWLNARLRPEYSTDDRFQRLVVPVGYELAESIDGNLGRAWFAREGGVSRLTWSRLGWRHPDGRRTHRVDFGVDRELLRQRGLATLLPPLVTAPPFSGGNETATPPAQTAPVSQPQGCLAALFGIFGKSSSSPAPSSEASQDDEDLPSQAIGSVSARRPAMPPSAATVADVWTLACEKAQWANFTALLDDDGVDSPRHEQLEQVLPNVDAALRRTDKLLEPLASLLQESTFNTQEVWNEEADRAWERHPVWGSAVHAAMLARSLNRARESGPSDPDIVAALVRNAATMLERAVILAAFTRQWALPSGVFVSRDGRRVLGAMPVPVLSQYDADVVATMVQWRRIHWAVAPGGSERMLHSPLVWAVPADHHDCVQIAVDFDADGLLSALADDDLDEWYYVPLRPLDVERMTLPEHEDDSETAPEGST